MQTSNHHLRAHVLAVLAATLVGTFAATAAAKTTLNYSFTVEPGIASLSDELVKVESGPSTLDSGTVTPSRGSVFTASTFADDTTGILKVSATGAAASTGAPINNVLGLASAAFEAPFSLVGPGINPVPVVFELDFNGRFRGGPSGKLLTADLAFSNLKGSVSDARVSFRSEGIFVTDPVAMDASPGSLALNSSPESLRGRVRLEASIAPGASALMSARLLAQADTFPGGFTGTFSGGVDGTSARLSYILPEGYSLAGVNGVLADAALTTSPAPEPSTWVLMLIAMIGLAWRRTKV